MLSLCLIALDPDGSATEHAWLFDLGVPIEPATERVHRITKADVAGQPRFAHEADAVLEVLAGADLAGYGVTNDLVVRERECELAGRESDLAGAALRRRLADVDGARAAALRDGRDLHRPSGSGAGVRRRARAGSVLVGAR